MLIKFGYLVGQVVRNVEQGNTIIQDQAKATHELAQMSEGLRGIGQQVINMAKRG